MPKCDVVIGTNFGILLPWLVGASEMQDADLLKDATLVILIEYGHVFRLEIEAVRQHSQQVGPRLEKPGDM